MKYAQKMLLVPSDTAERLSNAEETKTNTIGNLKAEFSNTLEDNTLNDDDKWKLVSQLLMRLLKQTELNRQPIKIPIINDVETAVVTESPISNVKTEKKPELISLVEFSVPKNLKAKAKALYTILESSPHINWDESGKVLIQGNSIEGSNLIDLLNDVLRNRKTRQAPIGWELFSNILKQSNVPQEYIGNEMRRSYSNLSDVTEEAVPSKKSKNKGKSYSKKKATWENFDL
jgi:hypothetical protein